MRQIKIFAKLACPFSTWQHTSSMGWFSVQRIKGNFFVAQNKLVIIGLNPAIVEKPTFKCLHDCLTSAINWPIIWPEVRPPTLLSVFECPGDAIVIRVGITGLLFCNTAQVWKGWFKERVQRCHPTKPKPLSSHECSCYPFDRRVFVQQALGQEPKPDATAVCAVHR